MLGIGISLGGGASTPAPAEYVLNSGDPFLDMSDINAHSTTNVLNGDKTITLTAIDGSSDRSEWAVAGLTVANDYELTIEAARGIGTAQVIRALTWGSMANILITSTSMTTYTVTVTATATSGVTRIYAADAGALGDTVIVKKVSVTDA